jgi:tetratricopeptide (TPR) repeat protein
MVIGFPKTYVSSSPLGTFKMNRICALLSLTLMLQTQVAPAYSQNLNVVVHPAPSGGKPLVLRSQTPKLDQPLVLTGRLEEKIRPVERRRRISGRSHYTMRKRYPMSTRIANTKPTSSRIASTKPLQLSIQQKQLIARSGALTAKMAEETVTTFELQVKKLVAQEKKIAAKAELNAHDKSHCTCQQAKKLYDEGRIQEAAVAYQNYGKQLLDAYHGEETTDLGVALTWEGWCYYELGRTDEAEKVWKRGLAVYSKTNPKDSNVGWIKGKLHDLKIEKHQDRKPKIQSDQWT